MKKFGNHCQGRASGTICYHQCYCLFLMYKNLVLLWCCYKGISSFYTHLYNYYCFLSSIKLVMCTVTDISRLVKSSQKQFVSCLCMHLHTAMNLWTITVFVVFSFCVIIGGSRNLLYHVHFCFMFIRISYQPKNTAMQSNQTRIKVLISFPDNVQFVKLRVGEWCRPTFILKWSIHNILH